MNANITTLHPITDAVLTAVGTVFFCIPAWLVVNAAAMLSESDRQARRGAQK